jgi:hypothetical protein
VVNGRMQLDLKVPTITPEYSPFEPRQLPPQPDRALWRNLRAGGGRNSRKMSQGGGMDLGFQIHVGRGFSVTCRNPQVPGPDARMIKNMKR